MKRLIATLTLAIVPVIGAIGYSATPASATMIKVGAVSKMSRVTLGNKCKASGGLSYGGKGAWGCTQNHDDGSSDSIGCTKSGCDHYHNDGKVPTIQTGGTKPVLGGVTPVGGITTR